MGKKLFSLLLTAALLLSSGVTACAASASSGETLITLSDSGVKVDGTPASADPADAVYTGADIIYYADGTDSTYGEGSAEEMHSAEEAGAHTRVTITRPGTYRITGTLSRGQIFVDLGDGAKTDPGAVVTLILDNVDLTCTVAPAVFFYRVYECDTDWVAYDAGGAEDYAASGVADTSAAGANVILAAGSENNITGSHVARIYKEGTTKKLHKYDGAFYSRMSMNLSGDNGDDTGVLNIVADNEGLDSELHLTVNGGTICIESQDDGINTNEDGVSVTTINGGSLTVNAGLGSEGDGIDSNGYLTINGGTIWTMANETSPDGGIDADGAITINGGTLYAFGTRNDAADSDSAQPYLELSFASTLPAGSQVTLTDAEGSTLWSAVTRKTCQSITLTAPTLALNTVYSVSVDGVLQCYSGNQSGMMGGFGAGQRPGAGPLPDGFEPPENFQPGAEGQPPALPEDFDPSQMGQRPENDGAGTPPEGGQDMERPQGQGFGGGMGAQQGQAGGSGSTEFILTEAVKSFSGVCDSDASGKTRVSFTVNGGAGMSSIASGQSVALADIQASVEDLDDSQIQLTITDVPSENYAESCLLSDGAQAIAAILPTEDGVYQLTVAVRSGTQQYVGASQWQFTVGAPPFRDVPQSSDAYEAVKFVYDSGLMEGTGGNRFSPDAAVTRAQAITVLARMAGAVQAESDACSDVSSGSWYSGYVGWAVTNGIVEGDGQGRFLPDEAVTGTQMEQMLTRCAALANLSYDASNASAQPLTRAQLAQMLLTFSQAE